MTTLAKLLKRLVSGGSSTLRLFMTAKVRVSTYSSTGQKTWELRIAVAGGGVLSLAVVIYLT